jgi:hypothetical protein
VPTVSGILLYASMSARIFATSKGGGEGGACAVTTPEVIIRIAAARIANIVRMLLTPI